MDSSWDVNMNPPSPDMLTTFLRLVGSSGDWIKEAAIAQGRAVQLISRFEIDRVVTDF